MLLANNQHIIHIPTSMFRLCKEPRALREQTEARDPSLARVDESCIYWPIVAFWKLNVEWCTPYCTANCISPTPQTICSEPSRYFSAHNEQYPLDFKQRGCLDLGNPQWDAVKTVISQLLLKSNMVEVSKLTFTFFYNTPTITYWF